MHHLNIFLVLKKKNGQKHFLHALRSETNILTSHAGICERACNFYENLYKNELGAGWDSESPFFVGLGQVSEGGNADLSGALNMGELFSALNSMDSGKVAGIYGLPVEFYNFFLDRNRGGSFVCA